MSGSALLASSIWTPLFALDRLNSWLRSDAPLFCQVRSALRPVIYWTKTNAILATSKHYHIEMRRVMVKKPCRRCDGTGVWVPFDWTYSGRDGGRPCRGCRATGTATLKFIETTIGPVRWHTPAEHWYMSSLDVYVPFPSFYGEGDEHYELADGWEPNKKGRPLPLVEVERDMLVLLRAWPHEVAFSLDFHHRCGIEKYWKRPDLLKAERWLNALFSPQSKI